MFEVDGETLRSFYRHNSNSQVLPSADGQVVYAEGKRYDARAQPLGDHSSNVHESWLAYPAATGPYYMKLLLRGRRRGTPADPLRLTIQYQGDDTPLLTVNGVALPDLAWVPGSHEHPPLPPERRLFWMPVADAIVNVPDRCDQLVIQHFNLKEELDKSGIDYFHLASAPPRLFKRGQKISYAIEVLSKQGGVQYTLESGPPGATVSPEGVLTWDVPADFSPHEAAVVVKLQNSGGQELSHRFKLVDGEEAPQVANVDTRRVSPAAPPQVFSRRTRTVTAAALSPPKSVNENRWDWSGGSPIPVRGEKGNFGGLILGDKLYLVKDNGALSTKAVTLPSSYMAAGLRASGIVGLAANPTRVEIVSRTGKLVRKVTLDNVAPLALALHPQKPICYACLDLTHAPFRGMFVSIDEQAGTSKTGEEDWGRMPLSIRRGGSSSPATCIKSAWETRSSSPIRRGGTPAGDDRGEACRVSAVASSLRFPRRAVRGRAAPLSQRPADGGLRFGFAPAAGSSFHHPAEGVERLAHFVRRAAAGIAAA